MYVDLELYKFKKLASFFSRFWKSYIRLRIFKDSRPITCVERNVGILYVFVLHSLPRCFSRCSDAVYWSLWCGLICLMFNMMFVQNAKAPNKQREASCCTGADPRNGGGNSGPTRDQGWPLAAQTAFTAFFSCSVDNFSLLAGSWLFGGCWQPLKWRPKLGLSV